MAEGYGRIHAYPYKWVHGIVGWFAGFREDLNDQHFGMVGGTRAEFWKSNWPKIEGDGHMQKLPAGISCGMG